MASYNTPIITNQGQSLLKATIANNDNMTFTKIVFSSDDYSQSTDSNVASLNNLSSLDLTAPAKTFVDVNGNLKIRGVANNQNTTSAFYIKTYGLYVKNSAGTETLFAVATTQNANFVPAYNNKQTNQIAYTFNLAVSSTNNITLSNQSDVSLTQSDLSSLSSNLNNSIASNASSIQANSSAISSVSSAISSNATVKYVDDAVSNVNKANDDIKNEIMEKVNANDNDAIKWQGWLSSGQDLNELPRKSGIWGFSNIQVNELINYPENVKSFDSGAGWGYVMQTGSYCIKQELLNVTFNTDDRIAYRIYETSWHPWRLYAHDEDINQLNSKLDGAVNQINANITNTQNAVNQVKSSALTIDTDNIVQMKYNDFFSLFQQGIFQIDTSKNPDTNNVLPSNFDGIGVITLIPGPSYVGSFITLEDTKGAIFKNVYAVSRNGIGQWRQI